MQRESAALEVIEVRTLQASDESRRVQRTDNPFGAKVLRMSP